MNGGITVFVYDKRYWEIGHVIIKQIAGKMNGYTQRFSQIPKILELFAHTYFLAILIVDEPSGLMTIKIRRGNDEIGHVE